jgi:O-antigen/teichoic acid export membrane protein
MKKPLRNLLAVSGADIMSRLLGFAITAYLARTLEVASFGILNIGLSTLGYVLLVASPGLHLRGIRDVAAGLDNEAGRVFDISILRLGLAVLGIVATTVVVLLLFESPLLRASIVVFALTAIPSAVTLDWYFQAKGDMVLVSASRVVMYVVYLVAVLVFVSGPEDVAFAAGSFVAGHTLAAAFLVLTWLQRPRKGVMGFSLSRMSKLVKTSLPLGVSLVLAQTMIHLPVLTVGALRSEEETGIFSAAMRLVFFLLIVDRVMHTLLIPVAARYRAESGEKFTEVVAVGLKVMMTIAVPLMILGVVFAPEVIVLIYGEAYGASALVLRLALGYFLFTTTSTVLMAALLAEGEERQYMTSLMVGTVCMAILCFAGTAYFGAPGAAVSLTLAEIVAVVIQMAFVRRFIRVPVGRTVLFPLIAGVAMLGVAALLSSSSPVLLGAIMVVVYGLAVLVFGGFTKDDIRFLKEKFV